MFITYLTYRFLSTVSFGAACSTRSRRIHRCSLLYLHNRCLVGGFEFPQVLDGADSFATSALVLEWFAFDNLSGSSAAQMKKRHQQITADDKYAGLPQLDTSLNFTASVASYDNLYKNVMN